MFGLYKHIICQCENWFLCNLTCRYCVCGLIGNEEQMSIIKNGMFIYYIDIGGELNELG